MEFSVVDYKKNTHNNTWVLGWARISFPDGLWMWVTHTEDGLEWGSTESGFQPCGAPKGSVFYKRLLKAVSEKAPKPYAYVPKLAIKSTGKLDRDSDLEYDWLSGMDHKHLEPEILNPCKVGIFSKLESVPDTVGGWAEDDLDVDHSDEVFYSWEL